MFQSLIILIFLSNAFNSKVIREKRQEVREEETEELKSATCDFGLGSQLTKCSWSVPPNDSLNVKWSEGQGSTAYWLGGPLVDHTLGDASGKHVCCFKNF